MPLDGRSVVSINQLSVVKNFNFVHFLLSRQSSLSKLCCAVCYRYFEGVMHEHKKLFFLRSVNAILGKVGRVASDEVILQLVFLSVYPYYFTV